MTKEELKKEAIKFAVDYPTNYGKGYKHKDLRMAYLAGAEPREKRIEELEDERVDFIGKLAFLENDLNNAKARIEKMKECANCPTWLLNQTEKNCRDCKYKEALILLRK